MTNEFSPEVIAEEVKEPKLIFTRPDLLTHPTLVQPLDGINPRTIMKAKAWDSIRRKAYGYNNYHCYACGKYAAYDHDKQRFIDTKLHAHECYDVDYTNCKVTLVEIVALDPICHDGIHIKRSQALYDKGIYDEQDMWMIFTNKERVLNTCDSNWSKWHLEHEGEKHFSEFKNKEEWEEDYDKE